MSFTKQSGKAESLRIGKAMPNEPSKLKTEQLALDLETRNSGFFCRACLTDKHAGEQSQDARYCNSCYQFLMAEAAQLPPGRYPNWFPAGSAGGAGLCTEATRHGHDSVPYQNRVTENKAPESNRRGLEYWDLLSKKARGKLER